MTTENPKGEQDGEPDDMTATLAASVVPGLTGLLVRALLDEGGRPAMLATLAAIRAGARRARWTVEMVGDEIALSVALVDGDVSTPVSLTVLRFAAGDTRPAGGVLH